MANINVFVSYSHADLPLVAPVVDLLRANRAFVFRDADTISPGKKWRSEIVRAIAEANLVVVFWCLHSSRSAEVEKEYTAAIRNGKDILPLLLDETPLHQCLQEYQWIDFRGVVSANHAKFGPNIQGAPRSRRVLWGGGGFMLLLLVATMLLLVTLGSPPGNDPKPVPEEFPEAVNSISLPLVIFWSALAAFVAWLLWRWRAKKFHRSQPAPPPPAPPSMGVSNENAEKTEYLLADSIEAEILRRTTVGPA